MPTKLWHVLDQWSLLGGGVRHRTEALLYQLQDMERDMFEQYCVGQGFPG